MNFFTLFSTDLKSASNSAFFYTHIKMFLEKYLWGSHLRFLPTLNPNVHKTGQKTENLFFQT
jgi:hypothetical protein